MSSISVAGDTSGSVTLQAPAVAGSTVLTLPTQTGTVMVNGPAFSAYQSSAQTLTATVHTKISLQTEEFDTNNNFDSVTNYRFTPTVAGYYQVYGSIQVGSTANIPQPEIYKNGSVYKTGSFINYATPYATAVIGAIMYLNGSTDYIELYGVITATAGLTPGAAAGTYFSAAMIRSA